MQHRAPGACDREGAIFECEARREPQRQPEELNYDGGRTKPKARLRGPSTAFGKENCYRWP